MASNTTQFAIVTDERVYGHAAEHQEQQVLDGMPRPSRIGSGSRSVRLAIAATASVSFTVHTGRPCRRARSSRPEVGLDRMQPETFHNNFQNLKPSLQAGGYRGRQLQVVTEGTWYINRLFATVDEVPKTIIPVGTVGVVVSIPARRPDVSAQEIPPWRAGGERQPRRMAEPLLPGKYAFNTSPARSRSSRPSTSSEMGAGESGALHSTKICRRFL